MSKRRLTVALVLAFLTGALIGIAIGYAVRTPGRASTWSDIRAWATFAVLVAGFSVAAYELNLQRIQLAEQIRRSKQRDDLLDGQLRELRQRETSSGRQQAESVSLIGVAGPDTEAVAHLINESTRPLRDVVSRLDRGDGHLDPPQVVANLVPSSAAPGKYINMPISGLPEGGRMTSLLVGKALRVSFAPGPVSAERIRFLVRFTDDAGLRWQLDNDMHLEPPPDRDW